MSKYKSIIGLYIMNSFATFLQTFWQVIEGSFKKNGFQEKISKTGKDYDCLCDLFSDFEEALTTFKFWNLLYILKFTYVENATKDLLSKILTAVVPLIILAAEKTPLRRSFSVFCRGTSLALELRSISQMILQKIIIRNSSLFEL